MSIRPRYCYLCTLTVYIYMTYIAAYCLIQLLSATGICASEDDSL